MIADPPALPDAAPARPADRLRGPEPAVLLHTSGTTGQPKLVPLTHQQLIVHAVVVGRADLSAAQLIGFARENLAGFTCPTGVTMVEVLPRNATGKVRRAALREPFWAGADRRVS